MHAPHDALYKRLFAHPAMAASLIGHFVPEELRRRMDLTSLELFPTERVGEDNRQRRNDLVWRIRLEGSYCYILFMLEFQSVEDWWMAARVLEYTALLWQDIIKSQKPAKGERLPLVLPLVIYNGSRAWSAPTAMRDLLAGHDGTLAPYQAAQEYYLLDVGRLPAGALTAADDLATALFRVERAQEVDDILSALTDLCAALPPTRDLSLHRAFIALLSSHAFGKTEIGEQLEHCNTLQEARAMLSDIAPNWENRFREEGMRVGLSLGREEGITLGREEGMSQGMKNIVGEILSARFGSLPDDIVSALGAVSDEHALKALAQASWQAPSLAAFRALLAQAGGFPPTPSGETR